MFSPDPVFRLACSITAVKLQPVRAQSDEFDSPWKEALEVYLRSLLEFCFPQPAAAIDWKAGVQFLDKELQQIVRDSALGPQRVDKLIKVKLKHGGYRVVLVHIEVQHRRDRTLSARLYQYHHRTQDRFGQPVLTLVILADENPAWRPDHYEQEVLGCRVRFDFPVCKLLELVDRAREQVALRRPSAVIVLANWLAQQTRHNARKRLRRKWELTRRLYEAGYQRKDVLELYRLIDWLLSLPPEWNRKFKRQVVEYEASKRMPYVTSIEQLAREEGLEQGREQGLERGRQQALRETVMETCQIRFGSVPQPLKNRLARITNLRELRKWHRLALKCADRAEFKRKLG